MATAAGSAPLQSASTPTFQPTWAPAAAPMAAPTPPARRRTGARIIVVIVVVIILVGVLALLYVGSSQSVNVTIINYVSPDNTCGWNGLTDVGFNEPLGSSLAFSYYNYGNNTTGGGTSACVIHTITTNTSGFSISDANVPLITPVNVTNFLNFTLNLPNSNYNGALWIILT